MRGIKENFFPYRKGTIVHLEALERTFEQLRSVNNREASVVTSCP